MKGILVMLTWGIVEKKLRILAVCENVDVVRTEAGATKHYQIAQRRQGTGEDASELSAFTELVNKACAGTWCENSFGHHTHTTSDAIL